MPPQVEVGAHDAVREVEGSGRSCLLIVGTVVDEHPCTSASKLGLQIEQDELEAGRSGLRQTDVDDGALAAT